MRTMLVIAMVAVMLTAIACGRNNTIPDECVEVLESYSVPENIIDAIIETANADLNAIERRIVRNVFERAGVGDLCGDWAQ